MLDGSARHSGQGVKMPKLHTDQMTEPERAEYLSQRFVYLSSGKGEFVTISGMHPVHARNAARVMAENCSNRVALARTIASPLFAALVARGQDG